MYTHNYSKSIEIEREREREGEKVKNIITLQGKTPSHIPSTTNAGQPGKKTKAACWVTWRIIPIRIRG